MGKSNYMQVTQPDNRIIIGIKDGEITEVEWGTLFIRKPPKDYHKEVIKYLVKTISFLNK
jgi:hypothetical protein